MPNRLAGATSPYLQQHAANPVDWFEWGEEAFAEARRRDVPLLLSVGYAACHWCHVMAHESFEDHATAAAMNAAFVNVKVDREERPDVDAVYMAATVAMSGQGGWPMTVFATPDGEPFFAGTYYPPVPAFGRPSFRQVLDAVADAWRNRNEEIRASAQAIRDHLHPDRHGDQAGAPADRAGAAAPDRTHDEVLSRALRAVARTFDAERGGFGEQPKFPPSSLLEWLLRHHARTGEASSLAMAEQTLEAMARGGIYDQLGGGFARYSVDAAWVVPHFEKMLYDNALLLRVYVHAWRSTGRPLWRRVAQETAGWLLRELRTPEGGFASSLDADSLDAGGHSTEGAFYVWTPAQLVAALGPEDAEWAARTWSVTGSGTFEHGSSVLQLLHDVDDAERDREREVRTRLLAARELRPRPARDDKVVAGWNGLAIAALAEAGAVLDRPDLVEAAASAADLVVRVHVRDGAAGVQLARTSRSGAVGGAAGVLEDYAHLADGLLALYGTTGDERWFDEAGRLLEAVIERFPDGRGTFYDTGEADTDPVLARLGRPKELADGPTPSGTAAAAGALVTWAALTGSTRHRVAAEGALRVLLSISEHVPRAAGWALAVGEAVADGPREVAVVGPMADARTRSLHRAAVLAGAPGAVLALGDPANHPTVPLLRERPLLDGRPAAYVCRDLACLRPTSDPDELTAQLGR